MDSNPSAPLYTVVILGLKDEEARVRTAEALSRMAGLPKERVLERLDRLPWPLLKLAPREKAQKLLAALEGCGAETTTIPRMQDEAAAEDAGPQPTVAQAPIPAQPARAVAADRPHIPAEPQAPAPIAGDVDSFEPLSLEGVLSPDFRLERSNLGLLRPFSAAWQVMSGTLRAVAGAMDRSFEILRYHFWKLLAIAGLNWLVGGGLVGVGFAAVMAFGLNWDTLTRTPIWLIVLVVVALIPAAFVASAMLFLLPTAALIHAVSDIYLAREVSVYGAYRFALSRLVRYAMTTMLMGSALTGAFVAGALLYGVALLPTWLILREDGQGSASWSFVVAIMALMPLFLGPISYLGIKLMFYSEAVIIEDIAYGQSLKRSWRLLAGRAGKSWYAGYFWVGCALTGAYVPLSLIISLLFEGPPTLLKHLDVLSPLWGQILAQTGKYVGTFASQILGTTMGVVFYYMVRSAKEGHDLLFLANAGNARAQDEAAT